MTLVEDEPARVGESDEGREETADSDGRHERAVRVERVDADRALTHVSETLHVHAQDENRSVSSHSPKERKEGKRT